MSCSPNLHTLLVFTCMMLLGVVAAGAAQGDNLIANPYFIEGLDAEGVPLYWSSFARSDIAYFELSDVRARVGEYSLRLVDTTPNQSTGVRSRPVPAAPGSTYRLEVDVYVVRGLTQIYLDFQDAAGRRVKAEIGRVRVSGDWETAAVEATAPEGTERLSVILYSDIVNIGEAYFDNVRLYDVTALPVPEEEASHPVISYAKPGTRILPDQSIFPLDITVAEWEGRQPALFDPLSVTAGPDSVANGPLYLEFTEEGLPAALYLDRLRTGEPSAKDRLLSDVRLDVFRGSVEGGKTLHLALVEEESGYELNNSYFTRRLARLKDSTGPTRLDVYTELIVDSMFLYMFPRLYLEPGDSLSVSASFHLDGEFQRLTYFDKDERRQSALGEPVTLVLDRNVTKPFLLFEKGSGEPGIAFFLPLRPEVRAWYHEHYLVADVPAVTVTITPVAGGIDLSFTVNGLEATSDRPHTFDFYYWAFPLQGPPSLALYLFGGNLASRIWGNLPVFTDAGTPGFWIEHWSNTGEMRPFQALRYYPEEGYSFARPDHFYGGLYTTMPAEAHVWGNQTINYKRLNFTGIASAAGLQHDLAVRHLQLYLDKADRTGVPPFRATAAVWFEQFAGLSNIDLLHNFHFAQEPEYMVKTALNFLRTGKVSLEDQQAITAIINRMLALLDPDTQELVPNTTVLPDGSYWYNYFEMETARLREGLIQEPGFVNNVHVTWLNVIVDAARLNRHVGNEAEYERWLEYFRRGVDGMLYVLSQPRAWATYDPNELLYGINWPGPNAGYAQYLLSGWLPHVMEFAYEEVDAYRLSELAALFRRIGEGEWTGQATYANAKSRAQAWLSTYLYPKDITAPITSLLLAGEPQSGERSPLRVPSPIEVAFSANDDLSGVLRIEYAVDDAGWTAYSGPFTLEVRGSVELTFRAVDHAGNVEPTRAVQLIGD